jgi:hypothetical protein
MVKAMVTLAVLLFVKKAGFTGDAGYALKAGWARCSGKEQGRSLGDILFGNAAFS